MKPSMTFTKRNVQLEIVQLLLEEGEDTSVREIARRLTISSSLTHYHMRKLVEMGVLIHHATSPQAGYYELQPIFTKHREATKRFLLQVAKNVKACTPDKLGNCINFFLTVQQ